MTIPIMAMALSQDLDNVDLFSGKAAINRAFGAALTILVDRVVHVP